MEKEIWKLIPSQQSLMASSFGRIMVIPYMRKMPFGGLRQYGGEPTYGQWDEKCKRFVYVIDKNKSLKVARLVCEAFHGVAPEDRKYCLHGDENSRNNRPNNLSWGTQKENLNAPGFIAYCKSRTGGNNPLIKGRELAL